MLGGLDLRSLHYYNIQQGTLMPNLNKYYRFKRVETLCEQLIKLINMLKKQRQQEESKEKYPWLGPGDERKKHDR